MGPRKYLPEYGYEYELEIPTTPRIFPIHRYALKIAKVIIISFRSFIVKSPKKIFI